MFSLEDAKKILSNKIKTTTVVLFLLIGVFLSLNIKLYVGNLVNYGSFMPPAISSVLKSQGLPEYKTKNQQIYEGFFATAQTRTRMSFHNFATEAAVFLERGSFGIFAHKTMLKKNLLVYHLLFVASLIALLSNIKLLLNNKSLLVVFSVFVFYFIFVIIEKYLSYIKMNIFGAGLQGRYLFPVLMCFYIVFASFLLCRLPNKIKIIVGCLVSCFFLYGSFVFFLKNVSPQWLI